MNQAEVDAFLAIVESGSLTRAAQKLYLTQSTLSSRLDCLEKELGAPLLPVNDTECPDLSYGACIQGIPGQGG